MEDVVEFLYLTPVGIIKFRPNGHIDMANPVAAQLLMPLALKSDMSNLYALLLGMAPDLQARVDAFRAHSGAICDQMQLEMPGTGAVLALGINKINADTFMAVLQDISLAIAQETRIRDDQQRFRAIFENIRDYAIYTANLDGRIDEWNRSLSRFGGWQQPDVAGASVGIFFAPVSGRPPGTILLDSARRNGTAEFEGWGLRRDGSAFWANTVATALPDRDGNANGYVLVTRDLTERKHMEDRLLTLATTDALTGALNRRAGEDRLADTFGRWQNHGRIFPALMIDCDHFKNVNDRFGHEVGDGVLVAIVRVLREKMRGADATIRWGGEEFLLLLPEAGRDTALAVAERVRQAIEELDIVSGGNALKVTVSIGVAEAMENDLVAADVVRRADHSLYNAKGGGRNRVVAD